MKNKKIKKESFMQSVAILMVSQILIKILGLIYKLYLTNKEGFGDKGNAIYSSGFQIYALFLTIASIGIPNSVAKLVSERIALADYKGAHRIFKIALLFFSIFGFLCSSILFLGARRIAVDFLQIPEAIRNLNCIISIGFFCYDFLCYKGIF